MRALVYERYGPPDVVSVAQVATPDVGPRDVRVRIHASAVNTGDWRIRAAAFPGVLAVPGRLMFGVVRPKNQRLGTEFSGVVDAVGAEARRFSVGERVYGFNPQGGASAEFMTIAETAAIAPLPTALSHTDGAALPFGALAAYVFLTRYAKLAAGQTLLVVGASGGVGVYAVQIAAALDAHVVGVAGPTNQDLVRALGASRAIDHTTPNWMDDAAQFDVILDTVGVLSPAAARARLTPRGLFLPLNFSMRELGAAMLNPFRSRKIKLAVNDDRAEDLLQLNALIQAGRLRPVIDSVFPLERAAEAHARVETRRKTGSVVLRIVDAAH